MGDSVNVGWLLMEYPLGIVRGDDAMYQIISSGKVAAL